METEDEQEVALLYLLSLGIFTGPNRKKLSFEQDKSQYLTKPDATRRTSRRMQDLSIWLKAFSRSVAKRHRPSSLLCFWSHRLMAWTVDEESVSNGQQSVAAVLLFFNSLERGTSDPGDNGARYVTFGVEDLHQFVSVTREEASLDVLWAKGRRSSCESGAQGRRASWTNESEGVVARETGATGRSFLLATSSARGCGW